MKSDSFVSVVLVVERLTDSQQESMAQILVHLDERYSDYELVLIAQGPIPDSTTATQMANMLKQLVSIRYIQLAARVNRDIAWAAGLENAIGDFVVLFNHTTDPVSTISEMVTVCKSGLDVVVGAAKQPRSLTSRLLRSCATRALRAVEYRLPKNATDLRCLSRRTVNSVASSARFHHQLQMQIQKTGYPSCLFSYELLPGAVVAKSLFQEVYELIRILVFNSSRPLRWMSGLGLMGSGTAFLFATYSIVIHFIRNNVVEGWTTTILFMSMLFMLQFIMLAFFGEYLGRLLDDRSEQADYAVVFEKTSVVMVNQDRVNVLDDSTSHDVNRVQTARDQ